jgi:hypothetical protein
MFVTSLGGVPTFTILSLSEGPMAPNWPTGIALGISNMVGGYTGAQMQSRLLDILTRHVVGIIAIAAQRLRSGLNYAASSVLLQDQRARALARSHRRPSDEPDRRAGTVASKASRTRSAAEADSYRHSARTWLYPVAVRIPPASASVIGAS